MATDTTLDSIETLPLHTFTEKAYLDYSMYVILDRALPHIGDGLKPVQRRIIYAMSELGLSARAKFKKSARTVGDVLGKFHPHGDSACYEAMVHMAQGFSFRYPLVDGQGNWGSPDDPKSFAAMRYTEARLAPFAEVLLSELGEGTVEWTDNFDGTLKEPTLLPARLPAVLLNGATGIAVGMATDIPPHNLNEVSAAAIHLLENPKATVDDLCKHIQGPDYPTGGEIITPRPDLLAVYHSGHGSVRIRACFEQEGSDIVVTELPYQVSGNKILEQIASQMAAKKLPIVADLRDESDHENPTRLVIVPRSNRTDVEELMSHLFATTDLERSYRVNMNMIGLDGRPAVKDLRGLLKEWLEFRIATVTRRLQYRLDKVVATVVLGKLMGHQVLTGARRESQQILKETHAEAETLKKQFELDARNDVAKRKEAFEGETNVIHKELKETERRLVKREDNLDRKLDVLTTKERYLDELDQKVKKQQEVVKTRDAELDDLIAQHKKNLASATDEQKTTLLRISKLSESDARKEALKLLEHEVQHEAAQIIQREMDIAEEQAKDNALKVILQAMQRYASDHTADSTVSAVAIPSDDMKGRIIGREGRNIRAFEKATGVDVIVDDTPGVVVASCFDPVRRAIAAEALKKLLDDGRIHPTRIEEVVEQIQKEMDQRIIKFGRDACIEANIQGLHPKISEKMGRLYYRTSYGQNILRHSIEVAYLCQSIADELGLDGTIARRCGFLHDIGKAMDHDVEGGHPQIGMEFCRKFGESDAVLNAIAGHHNDIPSTTSYTPIVMISDAISGARPGARRETLEKYIKRLEQLESIANGMQGVKQAYAIQAGREIRVIVDPDNVDDSNCVVVARDIAKRVSDEMTFPGEIRVTVLREMRTVEYARKNYGWSFHRTS